MPYKYLEESAQIPRDVVDIIARRVHQTYFIAVQCALLSMLTLFEQIFYDHLQPTRATLAEIFPKCEFHVESHFSYSTVLLKLTDRDFVLFHTYDDYESFLVEGTCDFKHQTFNFLRFEHATALAQTHDFDTYFNNSKCKNWIPFQLLCEVMDVPFTFHASNQFTGGGKWRHSEKIKAWFIQNA